MTLDQAKAAVQHAEQDLTAAETALKAAEAAETAAKDAPTQAAWDGRSAEIIDALKLAVPVAEGRTRIARLCVTRAKDELDRAKSAASAIGKFKTEFQTMSAAAQRVAAIDQTIATLAEGFRAQVLRHMEERLAVMNEAADVLQTIPVMARQVTDSGPLTARRWDPLLAALAAVPN